MSARAAGPADPPSPSAARNPAIDALRGLSVVLVVAHHVGLRIPWKGSALGAVLPKRVLSAVTGNGTEAVFVFFVLSGFLIASNTLSRWKDLASMDVPAFYARRFARIAPCLLALLAVLALLHVAGAADYAITKPSQSLPRALLAAIGLHLNLYEAATGYLPASWDVLWSLSIEEVFYLAFPLLAVTLGRTRAWVPALVLLALSLPITRAALAGNELAQEKASLPGMSAIATGVLAALVAKRVPTPTLRTVRVVELLGATGLALVLFAEDLLWKQIADATLLILTTSAAALAVAFRWEASLPAPPTWPGTAWLRSCGRRSYEIYLTHMFVVWPVVHAYRALGEPRPWGAVFYLPALVLSWLLGWAVARAFSEPAARAVERRLLRSRTVPA